MCTCFIRITFHLASKLPGREQECFGRIALHRKRLPGPKTDLCVLSIVRNVQHLFVVVYRMLLRAFIQVWPCIKDLASTLVWHALDLPDQLWRPFLKKGLHHSCTHCSSSHTCVRMHEYSTVILESFAVVNNSRSKEPRKLNKRKFNRNELFFLPSSVQPRSCPLHSLFLAHTPSFLLQLFPIHIGSHGNHERNYAF